MRSKLSAKEKKTFDQEIKKNIQEKKCVSLKKISLDDLETINDSPGESLSILSEDLPKSENFNHKIITKTYGVIVNNFNMTFSDAEVSKLENKINQFLDVNCYWITANYTPHNSACNFSLVIYAIDKSEEACGNIIRKIEDVLTEINYIFERFESELRWDNNRVFIEINLNNNMPQTIRKTNQNG